MIDDLHADLINREVDGLNSEKESRELTEYLSQNADAGTLQRDLLQMRDLLARDGDLEPPPNLKKIILNSIQVQKYPPMRTKWYSRSIFPALIPRINAISAVTLLAGVMLGFLSYSLMNKHVSGDFSGLYGTMAAHGISPNFETSDEAALTLPNGDGTIALKRAGEKIFAELQLNSDDQLTAKFQYPENTLSFSSYGQSASGAQNLSFKENSLAIENIGRNSYLVVFNRLTASSVPVKLEVFRQQVLVYEKTLSSGKSQVGG